MASAKLIALVLAVPVLVSAGSFSFTGTFTYDTDVRLFSFTLNAPTSDVLLRTWSYGGGVNAAGETILPGGFEPYLNLYLADGSQMNPGAAGPCGPGMQADPVTGACGDVYYPTTLSFPNGVWSAGTYVVALTTFANLGVGNLSDGFLAGTSLGLPVPSNFTCLVGSPGYQGSPATVPETEPFCDEFLPGSQRTGAWALDIVNVDSASKIPEPSTLWMTCVVAAGIPFARWRSHRK